MKRIFFVEDALSLINRLSFAIKKQAYKTDVIMGTDIGGDDHITKPFKLAIFLSRVNALLRRSENFGQIDTELKSHGIILYQLKHEVYKNGTRINLTANEYKLPGLFMENPDLVLTPEQILG